MVVEDKKKVIDVIFKHPDIMSDNAKERVIDRYNEIVNLKNRLAELRMSCIDLENTLKVKEQDFRNMSSMFDLVFATKEIETIKVECNTLIINPTDAARPTYKAGQ